jgi:hypothetical protein
MFDLFWLDFLRRHDMLRVLSLGIKQRKAIFYTQNLRTVTFFLAFTARQPAGSPGLRREDGRRNCFRSKLAA